MCDSVHVDMCTQHNIIVLSNLFQTRIDEYDYSKPLEGQSPKKFEDHWRKHTLSYIDSNDEVRFNLRGVVYKLINSYYQPWKLIGHVIYDVIVVLYILILSYNYNLHNIFAI